MAPLWLPNLGVEAHRAFQPPRQAWCGLSLEVSAVFLRHSTESSDAERSLNRRLQAKG